MPRLLTGPNGDLIPIGRMKRTLESDFLDGIAPGTAGSRGWWTTLVAGSFSAPNLTTGADCSITTGSVSGNTAEIQGKPCEARFMRGILWSIEGLSTDVINNVDIQLSIEGSNVGAQFFHLTGSVDPILRKLKTGGNVDVTLPWSKLRSSVNKKNLSMLLLTRQYGEIYLFQDDQCIGFQNSDPAWGNATGNVTPKLILTTRQAVAHTVHFTQLRQVIWSN